ncbi:TBC1 domain family member 30 [Fasciola gigantica]|uniref:TBC1 domain family member 30 n=1 Tax=Fasciola gigantica TaxID=46835 RepID=A0A504Y4Y8_FASGI|nr:TBC1 domain family member 30 [Fasciola gigantica]
MLSDLNISHTSLESGGNIKQNRRTHCSRRQQPGAKPSGRRGPGIFRPATTDLPHVDNRSTKSHHFKPSLTPGLGTVRVVGNHAGVDARVRFSMEPKAGDEAFNEWREAMRRMARLGDGLPKFVRRRVWSALADRQLTTQHVDWDHVVRQAFENQLPNADDDNLGSQIVKDLHRTGCDQFGSDEDRAALKRVLLAYAQWNKRVGYCQGFNMIAAAILDVMDRDEHEALKVMVYLIDYVLPESYFAQNLQALSVDIAVFRHLLLAKLPRLSHHLDALQLKAAAEAGMNMSNRPITMLELGQLKQQQHRGYEPPLMNVFIIQWFLTLFATCLSREAVLRIWDSIMLEGSEVILRTAVVMMEFLSSRLLRLKSADQFYGTMNDLMIDFAEGRIVSTQELLFEIYELAPFPYPHVKELREKFMYNIAPLVPENMSSLFVAANFQSSTGPFKLLNRWKSGRAHHMVVFPASGVEKRYKTNQLDKIPTEFPKSKSEKLAALVDTNKSLKPATQESTMIHSSPVPDSTKNESAEDEYQEISLSSDSDHSSQFRPRKESSESSTKLTTVNSHRPVVTRSQPCSDRDEDSWAVAKVRSTSCFANIWPQRRLLSIETASKYRHSAGGSEQVESISMRRISSGRINSLPTDEKQRGSGPELHQNIASDISDLGPGAVGEMGVPRPGSQPPLAHQARMSTNMTELKSVYRKQLARQRETTLLVPGLWPSGSSTERVAASLLHSVCMTAVLPQNRETKQMTFENSLDASEVKESTSPVTPKSKNSGCTRATSLAVTEDEVFPMREQGSRHVKTHSYSDPESICETIGRSRRARIPVDPDLIGAVQSWRAKAIWTCEPMPRESSGSEPEVERITQSHTIPVTECTAPNIRPTLRQLAERLKERERLISAQTNGQTRGSEDLESDSSVVYESAKSYPISPINSAVQSHRTNSVMGLTYLPSSRNNPFRRGTCPDGLTGSSEACTQSTDLETESDFTSVSKTNLRRAVPWAAATASFVSRKTHAQRPVPINLPLPLSPKRRSFGAQFGMYKSIPNTDSERVWANFCERVQTIGMQHRVMTR